MGDNRDMTITIRDVDREIHKRLRMWCFENEVSMNTQLLKLIAEFVRSTEQKQKK